MIEEQALRVVLFTNAYKPTVSGLVISISPSAPVTIVPTPVKLSAYEDLGP
jgi:hypothetical protein